MLKNKITKVAILIKVILIIVIIIIKANKSHKVSVN